MNYYKNISTDIFVSKDNGTHSKKNDSYAKWAKTNDCVFNSELINSEYKVDDGGRNVFQRDKCTLTGSCGW